MLEILKVTLTRNQPVWNGAAALLYLTSNSRYGNKMFVTHCSEEMHKHCILWLVTVELNRLKPLEGRTPLSSVVREDLVVFTVIVFSLLSFYDSPLGPENPNGINRF